MRGTGWGGGIGAGRLPASREHAPVRGREGSSPQEPADGSELPGARGRVPRLRLGHSSVGHGHLHHGVPPGRGDLAAGTEPLARTPRHPRLKGGGQAGEGRCTNGLHGGESKPEQHHAKIWGLKGWGRGCGAPGGCGDKSFPARCIPQGCCCSSFGPLGICWGKARGSACSQPLARAQQAAGKTQLIAREATPDLLALGCFSAALLHPRLFSAGGIPLQPPKARRGQLVDGETGLRLALQRGDHPNTLQKQQPTGLSMPEGHQGCRNPYVPLGMSHPKGKCRHKLEQATCFSPRAPTPNTKHTCNPKQAELERCARSTRSSRGLCLAFTAPLPSAPCCRKVRPHDPIQPVRLFLQPHDSES